jgi:hypothetical protein
VSEVEFLPVAARYVLETARQWDFQADARASQSLRVLPLPQRDSRATPDEAMSMLRVIVKNAGVSVHKSNRDSHIYPLEENKTFEVLPETHGTSDRRSIASIPSINSISTGERR